MPPTRNTRQRCWRCLRAVTMFTLCLAVDPARAGEKAERSLYAAPCCCEVRRAGVSWCHFPWARAQNECDYTGYYGGGGAPGGRSRGRGDDEGTWGWDYLGRHFKRKVRLGWTCPPREQGGTGSYQPDGPRVIESIKHRLEK